MNRSTRGIWVLALVKVMTADGSPSISPTSTVACWRALLLDDWQDRKARFRMYEDLEGLVMDEVSDELKDRKFLLQRDGFLMLDRPQVDVEHLQKRVHEETSFKVVFEKGLY